MALFLYRIGRSSFRLGWRLLVGWLLLVGVLVGAGLGLGGTMQESFAIPGTESQEALDRLGEVFPQVAGLSAEVVLEAPEGDSVTAHRDEISAAVAQMDALPHVSQALDPWSEYATGALSDDDRAAIVRVQFTEQELDALGTDTERIQDIGAGLRGEGLRVEFGGTVYQDIHYGVTPTEGLGVLFAAVVLIVALGSVIAAGMPLLSALLAVGATMGAVLITAKLVVVSNATPMLGVMIGLAVGIDYALFIISRHRQQLAQGMPAEQSAAMAVGTAGSAVVFAGATVMVALLGLIIVGIPFLSVMGVAAAGGVLLALAASVTVLPAMLGMAGERLRPNAGSRTFRRESGTDVRPTLGRRWVRTVLKAPWAFALVVIIGLGAVALPALHMTLSLPSGRSQAVGTTARDAYDIVAQHFGEGANGPLVVMLDITQASNDTLIDDLGAIRDRIAEVPGVATAGTATPNETVDSAIIQVIPTTGPDDEATLHLVEAIRALEPEFADDYDITSSVTGATAVQIDITHRLNGALLPFALIVVGLSFVLLMLVFRSILVPLKAALSFLLSAFAAFGVVVAVFQDGVLGGILGIVAGPIIAFLPVLLLAIVFGLAMDYEVFLVSGMREAYVRGASPRRAIEDGFSHGARVVTAAALIMFFVFAAFVPEGAGVIKVIALGLAVGIAFDAFLVRMTLVPALMALFGRHAWGLPPALDRMLPNLDIEGEGLRGYIAQRAWAGEVAAPLAAEAAVLGTTSHRLAPITFELPDRTVLVARGDLAERSILAATLSGRLDPLDGRLVALDHSLPGDGPALIPLVAVTDLADIDARARELSIGHLIGRHGALGRATSRDEVGAREIETHLRAANAALDEVHGRIHLHPETNLVALDPLARSVAQLTIAAAERPRMIVADLGTYAHLPQQAELISRLVRVAGRLLPDGTALVIAASARVDLTQLDDGRIRIVDLNAERDDRELLTPARTSTRSEGHESR